MKHSLLDRFVTVNGQKVKCVVSAPTDGAVPMVFRYGMYGTNATYRPWMKASLASAPVQVVGIPTPGFGCPPLREKWTLDNLVEFQQECLEQLEIGGPLILAAHSAGGPQQLAFASANKERVAAIIGVNVIGEGLQASAMNALGSAAWDPKVIAGVLGSMFSWDSVSASLDAAFAAGMNPQRISDALEFWGDVDVADVANDMAKAGIPVVLARSSGDSIVDQSHWEKLSDQTRATKVELGGSHMVGVEVPGDLVEVNAAFLETAVKVARIMGVFPDADRVSAFDSLSSIHEVLAVGRNLKPLSHEHLSMKPLSHEPLSLEL